MPENLTQLEDGRWLVTGTLRSAADIYHRHTGEEYAPHEATVLVSPDLLSSLPELVRLREENKRMREALTPSPETKYAYSGEFTISVSGRDEDGDEITVKHVVPWTCIKEIMAAIVARSALSSDGGELVQQRGASDSPQCDHPVTEKTLGQIAYNAAKPHLPGAPVAWCDARMDAEWRQVWHTAAGAVRAVVIAECAKVVDRFSQEEHEGPVVHESLAIAFEEVASEIRSLASATTSGDRTASPPESPGLNHTSSDGGEG